MLKSTNDIQISENQAEFLKGLIKMHNVKSILEIGTFHGFSTSNFAQAVEPQDGKIVSIEKSLQNFHIAKENLSEHDNIELILGDAMDVMPSLKSTFDFIFIDANKAKYLDYLKISINLLDTNGIIVLDNTLFRGYVFADEFPKRYKKIVESLRELHEFIDKLEGFNSITLEVEDGITILQKCFT